MKLKKKESFINTGGSFALKSTRTTSSAAKPNETPVKKNFNESKIKLTS